MDTCETRRELVPRAEELVRQARILVESHPQFVGRSRLFEFECVGDTLVIRGAVPTFYVKQILQNTRQGQGHD